MKDEVEPPSMSHGRHHTQPASSVLAGLGSVGGCGSQDFRTPIGHAPRSGNTVAFEKSDVEQTERVMPYKSFNAASMKMVDRSLGVCGTSVLLHIASQAGTGTEEFVAPPGNAMRLIRCFR